MCANKWWTTYPYGIHRLNLRCLLSNNVKLCRRLCETSEWYSLSGVILLRNTSRWQQRKKVVRIRENRLCKIIFILIVFMKFRGTREYGKSSMEFHGTLKQNKIPWNSMELEVLLRKYHGIPWNHKCCSNVIQKVPWNSGESSMEICDHNKFQWALERDFEWYFDTQWVMPEMHVIWCKYWW